jgi:hypothetical protein
MTVTIISCVSCACACRVIRVSYRVQLFFELTDLFVLGQQFLLQLFMYAREGN